MPRLSQEREPIPEKKETITPAEVVFVTEEIPTPAAMFEAYLLRRLGRLPNRYQLLTTLNPHKGSAPEQFLFISPNGKSRNHWLELINKIEEQKGSLSRQEKYVLQRMANYFQICVFGPERRQHLSLNYRIGSNIQKKPIPHETLVKYDASPYLYHLLLDQSLKFANQPKKVINVGIKLIQDFVKKGLDPFKHEKEVKIADAKKRFEAARRAMHISELQLQKFHRLADSGPSISFTVPVLEREPGQPVIPGETRVVETVTLERNLGVLRFLEGRKISIAIGGPRHSGKSTLTASLVVEINRLIDQAKAYPGFEDLQLTCSFMDLDRSTPDVAAILTDSFDQTRSRAKWTTTKALQTAKEFIGVEGNIILADAPGGDPDEITKLVIGPADLAILLIAAESEAAWPEQRNKWLDVLRNMGIVPLVQLRSRRPEEISQMTGEKLGSTITSFSRSQAEETRRDWIRRVGGRVVGLNRQVITDNPCVSVFAKLLLYDLIPLVLYERERRKYEYLNRLMAGYGIEKYVHGERKISHDKQPK